MTAARLTGPVLFAYDGSELACSRSSEAGRQLRPAGGARRLRLAAGRRRVRARRRASRSTPTQAAEVRNAAEETAAHGAALAETGRFRAQSMAV